MRGLVFFIIQNPCNMGELKNLLEGDFGGLRKIL
jgi:hypothetical protein